YTAITTFAGYANHAARSPASADFTISPAGSTTTVVCTGTPFTYDGKPHGCTATWASTSSDGEHGSVTPVGYNGRNLTTYGPSNRSEARRGGYAASATFAA